MKFLPRKILFHLPLLIAGVLLLLSCRVSQASETPEVTVVNTPQFLEVPATIDAEKGEPFEIAKTAPEVDFYLFPDLPVATPKTLWSSWGDGCLASNGKYYTSLGNHIDYSRGKGESRIYEYDPATKKIRVVLNIADLVKSSDEATGKVHGRIFQASDGWLYFPTYWGTKPDNEANFTGGSILLRYDPRTGHAENLGVPIPGQGLPTTLLDSQRNMLYFLAVYSGDFVAYDLEKRAIKFRGGDQKGDRNMMLDDGGNVYFGSSQGVLIRYDPSTNKVTPTKAALPIREQTAATKRDIKAKANVETKVPILRASTGSAKNGLNYGMTAEGILFSFDPATQTLKNLGANFLNGDYTAVMKLSPDGRYIYFAPGSHGSAAHYGSPILQYNIATGQRKVLAFLNPVLAERFSYYIGGSFNLEVSADGSQLFCTFNGDMVVPKGKRQQAFGRPSLVVINIPASERAS